MTPKEHPSPRDFCDSYLYSRPSNCWLVNHFDSCFCCGRDVFASALANHLFYGSCFPSSYHMACSPLGEAACASWYPIKHSVKSSSPKVPHNPQIHSPNYFHSQPQSHTSFKKILRPSRMVSLSVFKALVMASLYLNSTTL